MTLLVLRPQPGAAATLARAAALGLDAVAVPLFAIVPVAWDAPDPARFDAVMATSANALRHGGDALATFTALPLYAVGGATAAAARAAGFARVVAGDDDAAALLAHAAADRVARLLHLAGREHRAVATPEVAVIRRIVYAAEAIADIAIPAPASVALVHSPRAAARLADLVSDRARLALVAISARAAAAAGPGWRAVVVAEAPTDAALLAAAARLCEGGSGRLP